MGGTLLIQFTICSLCILTYCNLSYFPPWFRRQDFVCFCLPVIMWFLFGEVSSSSGCLGWATLFYCGTPLAFHIIILVLITSVPGHCLSFISDMLKGISLKTTNSFFLFISFITFFKQYNYIHQLHHIKSQFLHM